MRSKSVCTSGEGALATCTPLKVSLRIMCFDDQFYPTFPRRIRFWCQIASKQMSMDFPWRGSTKVKCHMSGQGISNLIHNRQNQCRRISWPSEISSENFMKELRTLFFKTLLSPPALLYSRVHLLWNASISYWKRTQIMFSPSATKQNKTHLHEFCVDKTCNFPLSISREILILVIIGTELVFTLFLCQCLPFEALVYIGHFGFFNPNYIYLNPLDYSQITGPGNSHLFLNLCQNWLKDCSDSKVNRALALLTADWIHSLP